MLNFILAIVRSRKRGIYRLSDEALMQRFKDGNADTFSVLLERHEKRVFNYILRFIGGDHEWANDLLQETFLSVIKAAPRYSPKAKFTTWVFTIARNHSIDALRKRAHRRHSSLDQPSKGEGPSLGERIPGSSPDGFKRTDAHEIRSRIEGALATLSETQREVFIMRQFLSMSFKEIADTLDVSEGTAKSRMRYALENLRLVLDDYFSELHLGKPSLSAGVQL